ncbi:beta-cystathionase [Novipirellula artificiosorum]|uniref:Flagellar M-ring protein n=1 Tax=Novipirellula artificiosorum TaxID=2528016 RepID=A0A5C6E241_9BACT|nr:beta-cystathionase [Novipirellula artificiosorum]TWU41741.1 Flagellar M-ring protein [Novipirellula artificiosorum]
MNFFNQSTEQMREAFKAMPVQSRIITVMLVAAIAIGLAFLVQGSGSTSHEPLLGGRVFNENELDLMELALGHAGLNDFKREGHRIYIPKEARSEYLAALSEAKSLPVSLQTHLQSAHRAASPFESNEQRHAREMHAKELDFGSHLARFPDIKFASVDYDRAERFGLSRARPQSASVIVTPEGTDPLPKYRIEQIKEIIRAAYAGMSSEDVSVVDTNSDGSIGFDEDADPLAAKRRNEIAYYEQKIRKHLLGYGNDIQVSVYAEIDPTMDVEKTTLSYDSERTTLQDKSKKIDTESVRPMSQGVPGVVPNAIGLRAQSLDGTDPNAQVSKTKEDERESIGVAGQQYENSRVASLQTTRVRAVITLPQTYYQEYWNQSWLRDNPTKTIDDVEPMRTADLEKTRLEVKSNIQRTVTPLLPEVNAGESKIELVDVTDYLVLPQDEMPEPDTAKIALTWLSQSWRTIALIFLALVALLVARSAIRSSGDGVPGEFNEGFGLELPAAPTLVAEDSTKSEAMEITGGTLKDELVTIVESNPEIAANVIRSWVAEAA